MCIVAFAPNHRTHERKRHTREAEKARIIQKIGMNPDDAPLFEEELRFMAYQASMDKSEDL